MKSLIAAIVAVSLLLLPSAVNKGRTYQSAATLDTARRLFMGGQFKQAADIYASLTAFQPSSIEPHIGLIRARLEMNDIGGALAAAGEAGKAFPSSAEVAAAAGDAHFRVAHFDDASLFYEKAARESPDLGRAWWGLGRVFSVASQRRKAHAHFTKAYALDPTDPDIVQDWAYTKRRPREIADGLESYLKLAGFRDAERLNSVRHEAALYRFLGEREPCRLSKRPVPLELPIEGFGPPGSAATPRGAGIQVALNGARPVTLKLSSYYGGIALTSSAAKNAKMVRVVETPREGRKDYIAFAERLRIGDIEFLDCPVDVYDRERIDGGDGMLGLQVLLEYVAELNFDRRRLKLTPLPPVSANDDPRWQDRIIAPDRMDFLQPGRIGPALLVNTRVNSAPPLTFAIAIEDSFTTLSSYLADQFLRRETTIPVDALLTCSVNCVDLKFDRFAVKASALPGNGARASFLLGAEMDGRLGFNALRGFRITFDYRNGLVKFE